MKITSPMTSRENNSEVEELTRGADRNLPADLDPDNNLPSRGLSPSELGLIAGVGLDQSGYHELLKGRDKPDQHPISSITGLTEELSHLRAYAESRGMSAYEIAVANGFVGSLDDWLASLQGGEGAAGAEPPVLVIESSKGNMFWNNLTSTFLTVVIYHGNQAIRHLATLQDTFGSTARLEWYYQSMDSDVYEPISPDDSRLLDDGFIFTISPWDVEKKATFKCNLVVDD